MIRYRRDLWQLVKDVPGDMVEVGVAEGNFSRDTLQWPLVPAPNLYMVDRWSSVPGAKGDSAQPQAWHTENFKKATDQISGYTHRVLLLIGDSVEMAKQVPDRSLRLVYVDADHSFEGVMRDLKAWIPKLGPGGVMAGHDFLNETYGVRLAVESFCIARGLKWNVIEEDKSEDAGFYFYANSNG